jgi:tellurite methyltransferase
VCAGIAHSPLAQPPHTNEHAQGHTTINAAAYDGNLNMEMNISEFFDERYESESRYWWRDKIRYSPNPADYPTSLLTRETLRLIAGQRPGRMLDLGAGEGSDSIRLARLGYRADAVDISKIGVEKILNFAKEEDVSVNAEVADIVTYEPEGQYDVVICNGVLHYISDNDKGPVIKRMQRATRTGGINVISLWSTYTPVPECHEVVPVFCDDEDGVVVRSYEKWIKEVLEFERDKPETSHSGMPSHTHSHIKLIARKP